MLFPRHVSQYAQPVLQGRIQRPIGRRKIRAYAGGAQSRHVRKIGGYSMRIRKWLAVMISRKRTVAKSTDRPFVAANAEKLSANSDPIHKIIPLLFTVSNRALPNCQIVRHCQPVSLLQKRAGSPLRRPASDPTLAVQWTPRE